MNRKLHVLRFEPKPRPQLSRLALKVDRLQALRPAAAEVIEDLVDDMLREATSRGGAR